MTISSDINKSGPFACDGITSDFPGDFSISDNRYVSVIVADADGAETVLALDADYTVAGAGEPTFNVTILPAPPLGYSITLIRNVPFTQETDLENQGAYLAEVVEAAFDAAVARDQQLKELIDRSVKIPASSDIADLDGLVADIARLGDRAQAIETVAAIAPDVSTVAGVSGAVTAVAGVASAVSSIGAISTQVTAVAGNLSNISAVAGNAANINAASAHAASASASANAAAASAVAAAISAATVDPTLFKWISKGIGELYAVDDSLTGVNIPPTNSPAFRYIKLTAGLGGAGQYNDGILVSESVSGSSPNIVASSMVALAGSPLNGQTIRLLNTERRFLRPGSAGTLETGQNLAHSHTGTAASDGAHTHTGTADSAGAHTHTYTAPTKPGGSRALSPGDSGGSASIPGNGVLTGSDGIHTHTLTIASGGAHTHALTIANDGGAEARPRNIGITFFMRIK